MKAFGERRQRESCKNMTGGREVMMKERTRYSYGFKPKSWLDRLGRLCVGSSSLMEEVQAPPGVRMCCSLLWDLSKQIVKFGVTSE